MKIKATKETNVKLTLSAPEAVALFWAIRPASIPEGTKANLYADIAREIETELGSVISDAGIRI